MDFRRIGFGVVCGLFLLAASFILTGCSKFSHQEAIFVAYNTSSDAVAFLVNDGEGHQVGPQSSTRFTVTIDVPQESIGFPNAPSTLDRTVEVSVAVKNLGTGRLTQPTMCSSGAKVVTHLTYDNSYGDGYVSCTSSY